MTDKERIDFFEDELNLIEDKNLKKFAKEILKNADDYFFIMPASTSSKYHPEYTNVPGGLLLHTKAVIQFIINIIEIKIFSINKHEKDLLIIAGLAHDIKKMGDGKIEVTVKNHPKLGADYIETVYLENVKLLSNNDLQYISNAIKNHMGLWDKNILSFNNDGEKVLHLADYLASRKNIEVSFKKETSKKDIIDVNNYVINFGKYNGKHFSEVPIDYLEWCFWL